MDTPRPYVRIGLFLLGRPVDDLAPYLGAMRHLVALREGDLAFLNVLQFEHEGVVQTAEFTVAVPR
jgi:hypothetical protein